MQLLTVAYFFSYFAAETLPSLFGPALGYLVTTTGIHAESLAMLPSWLSAGAVVGGLVAGVVFDSAAVKESLTTANLVLCFALVATAIFNAATPGCRTSSATIAMFTFGLGAFNGLFRAGANCLVLRVHGVKAAPYMQALHLFGGFGRLVAPLLVRYSISTRAESSSSSSSSLEDELQFAYFAASSLPMIATVIFLLLSATGVTAAAGKQAQEQAAVEAKPEAVKGAKKPTKQVDDRIANSKGEGNEGEVKQPDTYGLALSGALILLFTGVQSTYQNFASSYVMTVGFSGADSVMVAAMFGSCFTAGRVIAIPLASKLSARSMIQLDAVGVTIALVAMSVWSTNPTVVWCGTGLFGLSMASIFPSILNFAKQECHASAKAVTLIMQAGSAGAIFAPLIVVMAGGDSATIQCLGVMVVVADALFFILPASNVDTVGKQD